METKELNKKIASSVKWAGITEIASKMIVPFSNMLLARLLSPNEFGVVATVSMITSFADIFTDAGFQKYLIQHDFKDKEDLHASANVAFWTNFGISVFIWSMIALFSEELAVLVGSPGLGNVIIISGISLVLTSFSSIQMVLYKRRFDYKTLFNVRMVGVMVPIVVTIPLAYLGLSYWSIIIGTIATNVVNAVLLNYKSEWKPRLFYSVQLLKEMFSFSMWILLESILLWLTSYSGTFIVGRYLSDYYLGIYKNSLSMVNSLMNIIVLSTNAVLLSALSVVKNNEREYRKLFFGFQQKVSLVLMPMGVGVFLYRELATDILFGDKWKEASIFVGLYALAHALTILTGQYVSIVFTSKGKPKLAVLSQVLQLMEMIPILMFTVDKGFKTLVYGACIARMLYGVINMILARICLKLSTLAMLKNMLPAAAGCVIMTLITLGINPSDKGILWQIASIAVCAVAYALVVMLFPSTRKIVTEMLDGYKAKSANKRKGANAVNE